MTITRNRAVEMPTNPEILAYAAGLFDGEGSISIVAVKQNTGSERISHRVMVSLTNTDNRATDWMELHFGGWISSHSSSRDPESIGRKKSRRWQTSNVMAEEFLGSIRPYLVLKGEQADVALMLRGTMLKKGNQSNPVTPETYEYRESLRQKMLVLNKRGVDKEVDTDG